MSTDNEMNRWGLHASVFFVLFKVVSCICLISDTFHYSNNRFADTMHFLLVNTVLIISRIYQNKIIDESSDINNYKFDKTDSLCFYFISINQV
jgi:hypothetical protein